MPERPVVLHDQVTARPTLFARDGWWADLIQNDAGDVSGWHHHAGNDTYVYVIRGSITFEFGAGGAQRLSVSAGDSVYVPAGTIHRELTANDHDLEAVVVRIGGEPEQVNVEERGADAG